MSCMAEPMCIVQPVPCCPLQADFGGGGPLYMQCEMVPWYDWWSLLMPGERCGGEWGFLACCHPI